MRMSEFGSLQLPDITNLPFAISSSNDHYVVSTKGGIAVLQLRYKHINDDGALNYSVSRFECSKEKPTSQLETREINVYNSSNREQRAKIMLDQTIIPKIATLYIHNVLAVPSPPGIFTDFNDCLVAHLTNMGQLTLQRHDKVRNEWILYVDVSTTWIAHIYDGTVFDQFSPLSKLTAEALIGAFCWREVVFDHAAYFAFGTKSGKIVVYSLLSDSVRVEQIVGTGTDSVRSLNWVTISKVQNLLLAGLQNGKIALFSFQIQPDATVVNCEQLADIWGDADGLVVDHMQHEVDYDNGRVVLVVVKGTHLVATACDFQGQIQSVTFHNMNNFSITGIQQLSPLCYIVSTLTGLIFCVNIETNAGQLSLARTPVETDLNTQRFSIFGLTATRTRSCWLLVGFPAKSFDHLSIRQPTSIIFCKFSARNALQMLMTNPTLRMTDHYDCAELVRFSGSRNLQTLAELDVLSKFQPNVDDQYAYQLKLQLLQLGSRLSYFKKRCLSIAEVLFNQAQFITMVIELLHAVKVIFYFKSIQALGPLNYAQLMTIRCLRNFIKDFVEDSFPGDFEHIHDALKPTLADAVTHAFELLGTNEGPLYCEKCTFCEEPIGDTKLQCLEGHQTFRCSITKQQIPLGDVETVCEMCDAGTLDAAVMGTIFSVDGGQLAIYYHCCCICDVPLVRKTVV
uniref:Transcription factor IIIC 90kDa subunit N-terminal domain-containing protein n=1 Tax=Culex tarsalis TaxID=7177 RepID=A0A1Q3F7E5_CULTA